MFDYCTVGNIRRVSVYYYCLRHCNELALLEAQGQMCMSIMDKWSTHLVYHLRELHETKLLSLVFIPDA